jgi:hypothetical protein
MHRGELAVQFGFDKQGELQVEGYLEPSANGEFLAENSLFVRVSGCDGVYFHDGCGPALLFFDNVT